MNRESEFEIVRAVAQGKKEMYRTLVDNHKNMIFSLIVRQVGDRAVAEELTQETFLKAYSNIKKFRYEASFSTWLSRIALNQTSSYFTSKRYKQQKRTRDLEAARSAESLSNPEKDLERQRMIEKFREGLAELKPIYRDVIVACGLEGKSYDEAAELLKVPVGTVRSRLNKGRLLMQEVLNG